MQTVTVILVLINWAKLIRPHLLGLIYWAKLLLPHLGIIDEAQQIRGVIDKKL